MRIFLLLMLLGARASAHAQACNLLDGSFETITTARESSCRYSEDGITYIRSNRPNYVVSYNDADRSLTIKNDIWKAHTYLVDGQEHEDKTSDQHFHRYKAECIGGRLHLREEFSYTNLIFNTVFALKPDGTLILTDTYEGRSSIEICELPRRPNP